jgi:lipopolysaccharide export system protein LptC
MVQGTDNHKPGIERLRGERGGPALGPAAGPAMGPVVAPRRAIFNNRRRSRLLWLKILLPLVAVGTIGYLSIWSYRNLSETQITIENVGEKKKLDAGMKVTGIAFEGRNKEDRAFSVTALSATEATGNKDLVTLQEPQAQIELSDTSWIAVTAESGIFDRKRDWVDLSGAVTLYHDNGMTFVTDKAEIDLGNNDAHSSVPVVGSDERRQLTAEGFELLENGEVVLFKGRAHLVIQPKEKGSDG